MELWERLAIVAAVIVAAIVAERLVDRRMARRKLAPAAATRYRVLRRTISTTIIGAGVLTALLTVPQVRGVAAGLLASTAVVGLVIGLAAQRTLSNFIAGILIAISQPLRLGDRVEVTGIEGVVEEIGLTYTFIRIDDGSRLVIPNEKLASDTIRNSTIRTLDTVAEVTFQVPLAHDLEALLETLRRETADREGAEVFVDALGEKASVVVRVPTTADRTEQMERDLRVRGHRRLRDAGVFA